mgnify:CR=1 FL=1
MESSMMPTGRTMRPALPSRCPIQKDGPVVCKLLSVFKTCSQAPFFMLKP